MDKVEAPRLRKTILGLDEPHEICADGNGGSVEDFDTERRYHASVLPRQQHGLSPPSGGDKHPLVDGCDWEVSVVI